MEASQGVNTNAGNQKKLLIGFLLIILLLSVSAFSYMLGRTSAENTQESEDKLQNSIKNSLDFSGETGYLTPTGSRSESPSPKPHTRVKIFNSIIENDGFRTSTNTGNNGREIVVGRNNKYVSRGFVSFDISDLPQGVSLKEAKLRIYQINSTGNPLKAGKQIKVDHLTYGDSLDINDYGIPAISSGFAELLPAHNAEGWKEADVTARVRDDIANARNSSQFRFHFATELTGGTDEGDFVFFESSGNSSGSGNTPQLVVNYN